MEITTETTELEVDGRLINPSSVGSTFALNGDAIEAKMTS
jgi:hypothetical protein